VQLADGSMKLSFYPNSVMNPRVETGCLDSFVWVIMDSLLDSVLCLAVMIPRSDYDGAKLCPLLVSIVASLGGP